MIIPYNEIQEILKGLYIDDEEEILVRTKSAELIWIS